MCGVRATAAVIGVAAALGLCVWGGLLSYDAIDGLADGVRDGETRTPVPGLRHVELDKGKHVIYYEVDSSSVSGDKVPVPEFRVAIRRAGEGPVLGVDDYSTDFHVDSGSREAQAALTVEIPSAGRYQIATSGEEGAGEPAVVLGRPITRRILRLVLGLTALAAGLALGILVIAVVAGLAIRGRRAKG